MVAATFAQQRPQFRALRSAYRARSAKREHIPLKLLAFGNMKVTRVLAVSVVAPTMCACASSSSEIGATYVSPVAYQSYNCQQLALEAQSVSARAATLAGTQDSQRSKDQIATAAAIVVFWPAAFLVGGDKQTAAELAQMKGQMNAIEQASIAKKCNIQFQQKQ
jgi:hypothetical protein